MDLRLFEQRLIAAGPRYTALVAQFTAMRDTLHDAAEAGHFQTLEVGPVQGNVFSVRFLGYDALIRMVFDIDSGHGRLTSYAALCLPGAPPVYTVIERSATLDHSSNLSVGETSAGHTGDPDDVRRLVFYLIGMTPPAA